MLDADNYEDAGVDTLRWHASWREEREDDAESSFKALKMIQESNARQKEDDEMLRKCASRLLSRGDLNTAVSPVVARLACNDVCTSTEESTFLSKKITEWRRQNEDVARKEKTIMSSRVKFLSSPEGGAAVPSTRACQPKDLPTQVAVVPDEEKVEDMKLKRKKEKMRKRRKEKRQRKRQLMKEQKKKQQQVETATAVKSMNKAEAIQPLIRECRSWSPKLAHVPPKARGGNDSHFAATEAEQFLRFRWKYFFSSLQ